MNMLQLSQTIQIMPPLQFKSKTRVTQPTLPGMEAEIEEQPRVSNRQIAEVLSGIADLLEAQRGNPYRIQAYRNAARGILDLQEPAAAILARGEILPIPGLGSRLRSRITELVQTGTMTFQTGLFMETLPRGVRALMALEHIGPYTAMRLYTELEIDSVEKLWLAAQQQRIRRLPGFGIRSEARLRLVAERILNERKPQPASLDGAA